jgi:hypothetical protein
MRISCLRLTICERKLRRPASADRMGSVKPAGYLLGAQFNLSLLATACRNQGLVASLQRLGRRARFQAFSSASAAR